MHQTIAHRALSKIREVTLSHVFIPSSAVGHDCRRMDGGRWTVPRTITGPIPSALSP
jgi:hypothetical protein